MTPSSATIEAPHRSSRYWRYAPTETTVRRTPSVASARRGGGAGTVLAPERPRGHTSTDLRDRRLTRDTPTPSRGVQQPRRRFERRLGSQQVVSIRGRRVESPKADPTLVRRIVVVTLMIVVGLTVAMILNGRTTEQSFTIRDLGIDRATAENQIETLHRNITASKSTGEASEYAARKHMVIPSAPGLLEVHPDGVTDERIAARPGETRPIIDVNVEATKPRPNSGSRATTEVRQHLEPVPIQRGGQAPERAHPAAATPQQAYHNGGGQSALPYSR